MKKPHRDYVYIAMLVVVSIAFFAGRFSMSTADYETCIDSVVKNAKSENGLEALMENCAAKYLGRRSKLGPGYVFTHPKVPLEFQLLGPNPSSMEWQEIEEAVTEFLDEEERERLEEEKLRKERAAEYAVLKTKQAKIREQNLAEQLRKQAADEEKARLALERKENVKRACLTNNERLSAAREKVLSQAKQQVLIQPRRVEDITYHSKHLMGMMSAPTQDVTIQNNSPYDIYNFYLNYQWVFKNQIQSSGFECPTNLTDRVFVGPLDSGANMIIRIEKIIGPGQAVFACTKVGEVVFDIKRLSLQNCG